ncbi:MAG: hypothetical protein JWN76_415 [Chitinophagaceae bacterium]|nr:hypothetical protein [Chitinophagaceae bacterium]
MKAKEKEEKENIKLRYAVGLANALKKSQYKSFRDFALNIGFEPSYMQRIASGKVDIALSTSISLAEGLGISYAILSNYYDEVQETEIKDFLKEQNRNKRKKGLISKKKTSKRAKK